MRVHSLNSVHMLFGETGDCGEGKITELALIRLMLAPCLPVILLRVQPIPLKTLQPLLIPTST